MSTNTHDDLTLSVLYALEGILYNKQMVTDINHLAIKLKHVIDEVPSPSPSGDGYESELTHHLCRFFLPESVDTEMGNSGDFSQSIHDQILDALKNLLPNLKKNKT
jgi:hypothetical protein